MNNISKKKKIYCCLVCIFIMLKNKWDMVNIRYFKYLICFIILEVCKKKKLCMFVVVLGWGGVVELSFFLDVF